MQKGIDTRFHSQRQSRSCFSQRKYNYVSGTTAIALTDEWTKYEYSIELEAEQTVSIVFMSSGSKSVAAKDMLIDNASLVVKK